METNELRAQTYEVLSECFKEPNGEFAEDVRRGRIRQFLDESFRHFDISQSLDGLQLAVGEEAALTALNAQYEALFNHPFRHLVPVESVYRPGRLLMGEAAREMVALYERAGIVLPPQFAAMPDHLCLLLEFMALLCRQAGEGTQREFLDRHFGWLERLREDSWQREDAPFYKAAIEATVRFVIYERQPFCRRMGLEGDHGSGVDDAEKAMGWTTLATVATRQCGGER